MTALSSVVNSDTMMPDNHVRYGTAEVSQFDYEASDEFLTTKTYHGVSIVAGSTDGDKEIIGRIQSWQPDSFTRDGIHLYELSDKFWGRPVEYVPGKATGYTIAVTRCELWGSEMERAFAGAGELFDDLIDQNFAFSIKEFWIRGADVYNIWTYKGCWFTSKNYDALTSDGDGVTRINGTIAYVSKSHSGSEAVGG